jgi:UDP-4-amino-4,6-dideoxy-N-acetyl-beta-L-altrosamine N-acetyltransferase
MSSTNVVLKVITECSQEEQSRVREIRNQGGVRKWMYTDHEISLEEHHAWLNRLKTDDRQIVFVVFLDGVVVGVVSVNALDRRHSRSDWAFYLDENTRGGLGSALEYSFLNFVFDDLKLDKLNCEVIEGNDAVVKLHHKFGFEDEGFRKSNIEKGGERLGVYFLGMTRSKWLSVRDEVFSDRRSALSRFSVEVVYNHE